jgi:hypothetical protein
LEPYVQLEFEWILTTPFCHNKSIAISTICGDLIFDVAIHIIYMRIDFFFLKSRKKERVFVKKTLSYKPSKMKDSFLCKRHLGGKKKESSKGHKNINEKNYVVFSDGSHVALDR